MPYLKFLASTVPEIRRDQKILKVGHVTRDPFPPLFDLMFVSAPRDAKFEFSSFDRSQEMERITKYQK